MGIGKTKLNPADTNDQNGYLPEWGRVLLMHWPRTEWLTPESDFRLAMRTMERSIRNMPEDYELAEVVDWMAGPDSKQKYAPSLREFQIAIYTHRKSGRQESQGYAPGESIEADCRAAMVRARTHHERWNILCQPTLYAGLARDTSAEECQSLLDWACVQWSDFEDASMAIKRGYAREIAAIKLGWVA